MNEVNLISTGPGLTTKKCNISNQNHLQYCCISLHGIFNGSNSVHLVKRDSVLKTFNYQPTHLCPDFHHYGTYDSIGSIPKIKYQIMKYNKKFEFLQISFIGGIFQWLSSKVNIQLSCHLQGTCPDGLRRCHGLLAVSYHCLGLNPTQGM